MKYTQIPADTFSRLQLNAGILLTSFTPSTGEVTSSSIIGATTGGVEFTATPEFEDFGEDIDNCPKNTKELKKLTSWEVTMSGTFVTLDKATVKLLIGAADNDGTDTTKVIPRADLEDTDFTDLWWVGDYSDTNTGTDAGFVAIHMMNALNTGGLQITSSDKAKGQFAFEFTGHVSMATQSVVPFEVYVKAGA